MKKVLWFSRHTMSAAQKEALGNVEVIQVDGVMENIHKPFDANVTKVWEGVPLTERKSIIFKEFQNDFDIVAAVMPLTMQDQTVKFLKEKPFIISDMLRVEKRDEKGEIVKNEKGETQYDLIFKEWQKVVRIEIVKESFSPIE